MSAVDRAVGRRYVVADVFTDRPFSGNQLAVVLDAEGLATDEMAAIAREFGFSETTFVLPPTDPANTARVRIFTPAGEVPFAGHPNVGTAHVLAVEQAAEGIQPPARFLFEELAGLVPVRLIHDGGRLVATELTAPTPLTVGAVMPIAAAAACVSLDPALIVTDRHGPVVASVGLPFVVVEVASRRALAAAKPDAAAHDRALPEVGTEGIFLYTRDVGPRAGEVDIEARMFAPRHGVPEDPATGSAAAAAIGLIARVADLDTRTLRVGQGVDMGRPSLILGRVADGRVHVGGASVIVMRGLLAPAQPMGGA